MPTITVDGKEIEVEAGLTVLQACELAGAEIPRFCYHERLSIAGNCRMCLVEMEKSPKPIASCAMPVAEGMVLHTNTPTVKKAREGVMEFLLINHPLDCPICDQGGECDLQDQAMAYGVDTSRYEENKRAVEEKYMGPLIKTIMTRCIHCTRCVRFSTEVAGVEEIGAIGRGEDMEITTYLEQAVHSELSGNVIDLCPVGALTSKPYAFSARPWELRKTESVDVMDAVGSAIRVDSRGREVMRVLPRLHEDVNEEWISDKARFACDGLSRQRLDRPYLRVDGQLKPVSWDDALGAVAQKLKSISGDKVAAIAGDQVCVESMKSLKDLWGVLDSPHLDCRQEGTPLGGARSTYLFNTTIAGLEEADAFLLIGTNPRWEAPVLNARIRKAYLERGVPIGLIGAQADLTYPFDHLGAGTQTLQEIANGQHSFAKTLKDAERPVLILGPGALTGFDAKAVLTLAAKVAVETGMLAGEWNGFNVLHHAASRVGGLDVGFVPGTQGRDTVGILDGCQNGDIELVYLLGADEFAGQGDKAATFGDAFVVYQGSHGDKGAHVADVILPGAAYTEKHAFWVNTEGRVQEGKAASFPPGEAREDWKIIRAMSAVLGKPLPYDTLAQLRSDLIGIHAHFGVIDEITQGSAEDIRSLANRAVGSLSGDAFGLPFTDYYLTNPIARASQTMAECSALSAARQTGEKVTGTHG